MLTTSASDVEHNSNDHHDVKDLSFRTNMPQQAPVITSTAASQSGVQHMDTEYETVRSPTNGTTATVVTPTTRITTVSIQHHNSNGNLSPSHQAPEGVLRTIRMRKLSETSTDIEHTNNYKFKNYIQQRFTHENYHSEESMQSSVTENDKDHDKKPISSPLIPSNMQKDECNSSKLNGIHPEIKSEVIVTSPTPHQAQPVAAHARASNSSKMNSNNVNNGALNGNQTMIHHQAIPIPIFACHTQGFYVPLNVDYDLLIPFLGGIDLLNKNFSHLPPLHPISINVNYSPALTKTTIASTNFIKPKVEGMVNGW
jgi:hypothetical protein